MPVAQFLFFLALGLVVLVLILWWRVRRWVRRGRVETLSPPAEAPSHSRLKAWLMTPVVMPLAQPAAPQPRSRPLPPAPTHLTLAQLRSTITVLLLGGGMLAVLAQLIYSRVFPFWQSWVQLLTLLGVMMFLWGMRLTVRPRIPQFLIRLSWWLSHFFHLAGWQMTLLIIALLLSWLTRFAAGNSLEALHPGVMIAAWAGALMAVILGSYRWWQAVPFRLSRGELLGMGGLFLAALLLRATFLTQYPNTLSGDEGSAGLMATGFYSGRSTNLFAVGWFSFPTLYYWVQSWGLHLLGQTTEGLRITSAVAGALSVVAVYGLGRVLVGRLVGGIAAALLLASHYHIQFSRIGLNNIWDGLFLIIALTALWYGWKTGWRGAFIICGLAVGLGQYFYVSIRVLPLLLLLWSAAAFLLQRHRFRQRWPDLLLTGLIAFIVFLPLLHFFASHRSEFNAPLQRVTIFEWWLEAEQVRTGLSPIQIVLEQMKQTALGITHEPLRHWYNPGTPLLLAGQAALFLLGVLWSLLAFDLRYLLLWLPLLAHILLGGFSQDAPASQRFVWVMPVVALFVALPLARTVDWLQQAWPGRKRVVGGVAAAFLLWLMLTDLNYYFFQVYQNGYVLGGVNTEAATQIAHYLRDHPQQGQVVYFFGLPRMGYASLSTIPYLAPGMIGYDIFDPLNDPPAPVDQNILCIFLPERLDELVYMKATYFEGVYQEFYRENGDLLFAVYDVP